MTGTVSNGVLAALVAKAATLVPADWAAYDGYPLADDPRHFVSIGVDDPGSTSQSDSVDTSITYAHASGRKSDEEGTIRCAAWAADGGGSAAAARSAVYGVLDAFDGWIRGEQYPLGQSVWMAYISSVRLYQDQTTARGAEALLVFTIAYRARI